MIVGVGIDQVKIERIRSLLDRRPERARARLFTGGERECCEQRARPMECYAARFAAKEAFLKALGTGLGRGIRWRDIEVTVDGSGRPVLAVRGAARRILAETGGSAVHVSFTHEDGLAAAVVVIEREGDAERPR